ncbi:AmmeMemoRadiSam system radical SAM enzyme [Candidatus Microgenomates bacterium]|nr:AmmeMemoRadiSam system radical SAM enzyme [Candidatus Microgenomates bacterium]
MRQALLYKKLRPEADRPLDDKKIRCNTCLRRCIISSGKTGFCLTRLNKNNKLYTLIYGLISATAIDPIEKKPLYHFYPGSPVFSISSWGCNFRCFHCLNDWCSWGEPATSNLRKLALREVGPLGRSNLQDNLQEVSPKEIIKLAIASKSQGIAFTYQEPSIWLEYTLDVAKLAKKEGLYTVYVTNGYATKEQLDLIGPYLDAQNVDFKGWSKKSLTKFGAGTKYKEMAENIQYALQKYKVHTELTTLIVPTVNDNFQEMDKMTKWIVKNLGPKIPWHISRFNPAGKRTDLLPTPIKTLKKIAQIGRKNGLAFVYVWAPGHDLPGGIYYESNTYCPKCKSLVIQRGAWNPKILAVDKKGRCSKCGEDLNIIL